MPLGHYYERCKDVKKGERLSAGSLFNAVKDSELISFGYVSAQCLPLKTLDQ